MLVIPLQEYVYMYNLGTPYFSKGISSMKQCDTTRIFSSLLNANYSELQNKEVAFKISCSFSVQNCTVYVSMCGICQIKLLLFIVQHMHMCSRQKRCTVGVLVHPFFISSLWYLCHIFFDQIHIVFTKLNIRIIFLV